MMMAFHRICAASIHSCVYTSACEATLYTCGARYVTRRSASRNKQLTSVAYRKHALTHLLTRDLQLFARKKSSDEPSKQLLTSRWSSCKRTKKLLINFSETPEHPAFYLRSVVCTSIDTVVAYWCQS